MIKKNEIKDFDHLFRMKNLYILPEGLEAERNELEHQLKMLQHRKYNHLNLKQIFTELIQHKYHISFSQL